MFVLHCIVRTKGTSQDKEIRIKNEDRAKEKESRRGHGYLCCVCCAVKTKVKMLDSQDKETSTDEVPIENKRTQKKNRRLVAGLSPRRPGFNHWRLDNPFCNFSSRSGTEMSFWDRRGVVLLFSSCHHYSIGAPNSFIHLSSTVYYNLRK
jgi:hypothetical protein